MRIVLDTNVWVSGLLWGGSPGVLLDLIQVSDIHPMSTPAILAELFGVLQRPKFKTHLNKRHQTAWQLVRYVRTVCDLVPDRPSPIHIIADPTDEKFLAAAITSRADAIVSGDRHLLKLKNIGTIPILTPAQFLKYAK